MPRPKNNHGLLHHLPKCPMCSGVAGAVSIRGFWRVGCPNDRCQNLFIGVHVYSFYAQKQWKCFCDPGLHFGRKIIMESDHFTA